MLNPNIVMIGYSTEVVEVAETRHETYSGDRLMLTYAQKIAVLDHHKANGCSVRATCSWVCTTYKRRTYDRSSLRNLLSNEVNIRKQPREEQKEKSEWRVGQ